MLTKGDIRSALPELQKYARLLTRTVVDADDLIQDTLMRAWTKRARYYGGGARAWLFTGMHNVHVSNIRRICAKTRTVDIRPPAEDSSLVDASAFSRLIVRDVARELQTMPEGMRQAVVLAAASTADYRSMAARLKIIWGRSDRGCLGGGNVFLRNLTMSQCLDHVRCLKMARRSHAERTTERGRQIGWIGEI